MSRCLHINEITQFIKVQITQTFVLLSILSDWILTATVSILGLSTPTPSEVVLLRPSSSEKQIVGSNQWGRIVLGSRTSEEGTTPSTKPAKRFWNELPKLLLMKCEGKSFLCLMSTKLFQLSKLVMLNQEL